MIKLSLSEGVAFDMLSILLVKSKKKSSPENCRNYHEMAAEIKDQIGVEKLYEVLNSSEWANLYDTNDEVFRLVDAAKTDSIKASEVDNGNYRRYLCKKALQEKFFDGEFTEQKIGYG